jgi:hypothetical protein
MATVGAADTATAAVALMPAAAMPAVRTDTLAAQHADTPVAEQRVDIAAALAVIPAAHADTPVAPADTPAA